MVSVDRDDEVAVGPFERVVEVSGLALAPGRAREGADAVALGELLDLLPVVHARQEAVVEQVRAVRVLDRERAAKRPLDHLDRLTADGDEDVERPADLTARRAARAIPRTSE